MRERGDVVDRRHGVTSLPNLHPFLVHFPIALFTTAVICDVVLVLGARQRWLDRCAVLLFAAAALGSGAAALSGKLAADGLVAPGESAIDDSVITAVGLHGDWAFLTVVILFVVAAMRFESMWRDRLESVATLHRTRLLAFAVAMMAQGVLVHTAGRGGELVYRYGVAVGDHAIIPERR